MTFEPLSLTKGILIGYCLGAPLGVVFALMSPDADGYFYIDTMLAKVGGCGFLGGFFGYLRMSHLRGELSEGRAHMDYIQTLRAHVLLFALVLVSLGICYVVQSLAS